MFSNILHPHPQHTAAICSSVW